MEPGDDDRTDRADRPERGDRKDTDDERENDGLSEVLRRRLEQLVPEIIKRTVTAGVGAMHSTEEGIRKMATNMGLPDVAGYIASGADATKDKVLEVVARETREFLASMNIADEVTKMLTTLSFEIKTEIRFIPNSERFAGAEPDVKASVRLKRSDAKAPDKGDKSDKPDGKDS